MDWSAFSVNTIKAAGAIATVVGTLVTAVATVFLWRVTRVLAIETRRMAEASAQPQVVVSIDSNQWAMMYADITVANTGNATAFDITVAFDPPIEREALEAERPFPLEKISLLKPGQQITSFLSAFEPIINKAFTATVTWKRDPNDQTRQSLSYQIDLAEIDGRGHLGASSPMTQIADQVKKIREDWQPVARGSRKLSADVFTSGDRLRERRNHLRYRRRALRERAEKIEGAPHSDGDDQG